MTIITFTVNDYNFRLRHFRNADLDNLVKHADNFNISQFLTDKFPHPYTEEHGRNFIHYTNSKKGGHQVFAIELNGEVCGGIGLHPQEDVFQHNAELGYWIGDAYWGKGIVTEAIRHRVNYGFANMEIKRIFARPFSNNT